MPPTGSAFPRVQQKLNSKFKNSKTTTKSPDSQQKEAVSSNLSTLLPTTYLSLPIKIKVNLPFLISEHLRSKAVYNHKYYFIATLKIK